MLLPAAIWVVRLVRFVSVSLGALTIRTRMFGCSFWNSAMSLRRRSPPSFEATWPAHQLIVASPSGGSVGQFRLSSVGAPAGWLVLAVLGELLVGAVVVVLRDAWRLRR